MKHPQKGATISVTYYIDDLSQLVAKFEEDALRLRESAEHSDTKRAAAPN